MKQPLDSVAKAVAGTAPRIGVYVCQTSDAAQGPVDLKAVAEYAGRLPGVALARVVAVNGRLAPEALAEEIRKQQLNTVVVAGYSPGFFKPAFTRALAEAGADPENVRLASFREHGVMCEQPLERAKAVVNCAVNDVPFSLAAEPALVPVNSATLIIGGGIAGIQAALEIADAGHQVYLVERWPTIGGHMAMFDKTFPTLDCSACILTPKMVAAGQHQNIKLMVLSEVKEVTGRAGEFRVKVLQHATRVDPDACVACNDCTQICPTSVDSEFDVGIAKRKAIYLPFQQAVPNSYVVDPGACLWIQSGGKKCGACLKKCAKDAIHLDAQDEVVELEVGNIIVATGYDPLDAHRIERYGYGKFPNVITALEFERLSNASGPTGGKILLKEKKLNKRTKQEEWVFHPDNAEPKSVAIIHCVGSRDRNYNPYCSRVCCMYSLKFAHLVKDRLHDANVYEYYIDMRAFGKNYEDFFERVKEEGVFVSRGRTNEVVERNGQMMVRGEDILKDRMVEMPVEMVVLALGLQPADGAAELAKMLGISRNDDGWFAELNYNTEPNATERGGIFVAGVCQGPKDIPDTVAQASAVAARVLRSIVSGAVQDGRSTLTLADIEQKVRALAQPGI
jgi:heterodisulfide reductase subunit A